MSNERSFPSEEQPVLGLLDHHVESFVSSLQTARYGGRRLRTRRRVAASFARWTRETRLPLVDLDESHAVAFLRESSSKGQLVLKRATLRNFIRHVRSQAEGTVFQPKLQALPCGNIEKRYVDYLRNERGLAERSICIYLPYIRDFLNELEVSNDSVSLGVLDAQIICNFLLDRVRDRSSESSRLLTVSLRSFLRFLYLRGETPTDLSQSVPTVRRWSQAAVPAFLSPEEVKRVLSTADRSTPRGRRDHAILLLLARLGLRAGEIVGLELGDIRWRTGEIVVRGKGCGLDRLPLPSDVGEALALYLRKDRGSSTSRQVFLRLIPPRVGLAGPAAVGHIVRLALTQAGLRRSSRGAAHLFRHSLATTMIRQGASMAEISEVLRHRSQISTTIYAKVAFDALREVARPWPGKGGTR